MRKIVVCAIAIYGLCVVPTLAAGRHSRQSGYAASRSYGYKMPKNKIVSPRIPTPRSTYTRRAR